MGMDELGHIIQCQIQADIMALISELYSLLFWHGDESDYIIQFQFNVILYLHLELLEVNY